MAAQDPLLEGIQRRPVDHVPAEATPAGTTIGASPAPLRTQASFIEPLDAVINLDIDAWTLMVQEGGAEFEAGAHEGVEAPFVKRRRRVSV